MPFSVSGNSSVPFADQAPNPEAGSATAGTMPMASRGDHVHPRLTATALGTLNASGEATVTFTRTFTVKPAISVIFVESADNQPVIFKVKSWAQDGSNNYTGCTIKGYRLNTLPATLTLLSALVSFSISSGSASGVEFTLIALQQSS